MSNEVRLRTVMSNFISAMEGRDAARLRASFHPQATIVGKRSGLISWLNVETFSDVMETYERSSSTGTDIDLIIYDMTADTAILKFRHSFRDEFFTSHVSLLCVGGDWLIVNMTFSSIPL